MDRIIPTTMASQHPDHANTPFWHTKPFISTRHEVRECFIMFSELGISEFKWDWEGKYVDESVIEKLLSEHFEYFSSHPIGREKFITYRLPNPKVETEFRIGRAFMGILSASALAHKLGLHTAPLFEVILPMTESSAELLGIQEAYKEIASLKHALYQFPDTLPKQLDVIPLFEQIETIMDSDGILEEYIHGHKTLTGSKPAYMRPYVARSDPALNSGIIPTVLAIKVALSRYKALENRTEIKMYPIIGSATLPFRGGLSPKRAAEFADEYQGVRTALIQSAFRYDFPLKDVLNGISTLDSNLQSGVAQTVSKTQERTIRDICHMFEVPYRQTIEGIAPIINAVASHLPKRRERVQHTGLFGYSRGVGAVRLPRAITFTGSLYSLGVPPELIGTGRGIAAARKAGMMDTVERFYVHLKHDLRRAGSFLNKDALSLLADTSAYWADVNTDIRQIEEYLGEEIGPSTQEEKEHSRLSWFIASNIDRIDQLGDQILQAALLRKSLG